jgi:tetratricopeptide (TPR) repeat protein
MAEILHAEELDPTSLIINTDIGWGLYYARKYDEAIEQLRRTLELDSNFAVAHLILGLAQAQKTCFDEALTSVQRAIKLSGKDPFALALGALGYIDAVSGRTSAARAVISHLKQSNLYYADYCEALVLAGLGRRAPALDRLESAFKQRHDRLIYLNVEPIFDSLRADPRFLNLVRRVGL